MNMSFIEKLVTIFKYIGSSFLSIELFVLSLLLFLLLIANIKYKNKYANYIIVIVYLVFLVALLVAAPSYIGYSFDSFIKKVMNYIYFPSTIVYFFIMIFSILVIIYSMFSKSISVFKKVFNYAVFNFMFFFFLAFISICTYNQLDLSNLVEFYKNDTILAIVQISNLLLFGWCLFTFFYRLYLFFKKTFDNKIEN
ncbi:MAG: hypothetical protein E7160_03685 [Firmicutes bacterium]|nr:hypothetical protein [Bacillota bacterium]